MIRLIPLRGYFDVNAYFYIDDAVGRGFLIDPGAQPDKVMSVVRRNGWTIEKILLTHGHFDHMGAASELRDLLGAEIYAFDRTGLMLQDAHTNLSALCGPAITIDGAIPLTDGETISLESDPSFCLKVMHTPGHTPDSVTFYSERDGVAFVGDTIFKAGIGSWEYPGGNKTNLIKSIMERIFALPDETVLCSGHSEQTTIGTEKRRYRN
jgi:glyoxylase-like metal-dependent hydrolase (beta-lactamase superfamily II)